MSPRLRQIAVLGLLYALTATILASIWWSPLTQDTGVSTLQHILIVVSALLMTRYVVYASFPVWYAASEKLRRRRFADRIAAYRPLVSVVIPAWNEEVGLVSTVKSALASDYPNLEVVVINDGSTDRSDAHLRAFLQQNPSAPVTYRYQTNRGKAAALNHGVRLARGEIIVTVDADCALDHRAVSRFVERFADPDTMACVGTVRVGHTTSFLGLLQSLDFRIGFYLKRTESALGAIYIIGGAAGALRREVFSHIGLFQEGHITEDIDFTIRLQRAGLTIRYAADAIVYTEGASTWPGLFRQRLRWKLGRLQTFWEHRHLFFRTSRRHHPALTWGVLPLALLGDAQLPLDFPILAAVYLFALRAHNPSAFLFAIALTALLLFFQTVTEHRKLPNLLRFLAIAPVCWLMSYCMAVVEIQALVRSVWTLARRRPHAWQRWQRVGVFGSAPTTQHSPTSP